MFSSKPIGKNFIQDYISDSTQVELDNLQDQINSLPVDTSVVHRTGNLTESINGLKTFTSLVTASGYVIPLGTSSQFLKADGSVDSTTYANDSNVIHTSGNETRTGSLTSDSFIKAGGLSSQFLKADGSSDSTVYAANSSVVHIAGSENITGNKTFTVQTGVSGTAGNASFGLFYVQKAGGPFAASTIANLGSGKALDILAANGSANVINVEMSSGYTGRSISTTLNGVDKFFVDQDGNATAATFVKAGGTAAQFLKANGSVDSTVYQSLLINPVTGTGTSNRIVKWLTASQTGNSNITDNGTTVTFSTDTTFSSGNITLGTTVVTENRVKLNSYQSSTGITSFGAGGIAITSGTTFDVAIVAGFIVSSTNPLGVPPIPVSYPGGTGLTTPYIGSHPATYVLVNSSNALVLQNTRPTVTDKRNMIYLGVIGHPTGTLTGVSNNPDIIMNEMSQIRGVFEPIRLINEGIRCYNNSTNLTLANTVGILYGFGIGWTTNGNDAPSILNIAAGTPTTFQYRTQTGISGANTTLIVPGSYDVAGTVTAIPATGTRFSNQRIYLLQNGSFRVQYGQNLYYTLGECVANASREPFVVFPNNSNLGILIGILGISKDCTDLSNTNQARFLPISKFGETIGASSGQAGGYLLASLTSSGNADQVLTTTSATVNFDLDENVAYGGISRSGNVFTVLSEGNYQIIFQPQILQNSNGNVVTMWARKNGVDIPRSGVKLTSTGAGDSTVLPLILTLDLVPNDTITFHGLTSAVNGATLDFIAAGGGAPAVPAVLLDIKGWKK